MQVSPNASRWMLGLLVLAGGVATWFTFQPLAESLLLAAMLAVAIEPIQRWLSARLGGRRRLAAGILLLVGTLVVLASFAGLSAVLVSEIQDAIKLLRETLASGGLEKLIGELPRGLSAAARRVVEQLRGLTSSEGLAQLPQQVGRQATQAAGLAGMAVVATGSFIVQATLMLIALFFFLTEKDGLLSWVAGVLPLTARQTDELIEELRRVTGAMIRSTVLTAGVQAFAGLIGYLIAGVPNPVFFTALTFLLAMVPVVGGAVVCLLAGLLMLVTGHPLWAIFLGIWAVTVVGLSDNVAKPLIARHGVGLHGGVVFFSLIGGLAAFGTIGIVLGPVAVAFFVAALRIYRRDYSVGPPEGIVLSEGTQEGEAQLRGR